MIRNATRNAAIVFGDSRALPTFKRTPDPESPNGIAIRERRERERDRRERQTARRQLRKLAARARLYGEV